MSRHSIEKSLRDLLRALVWRASAGIANAIGMVPLPLEITVSSSSQIVLRLVSVSVVPSLARIVCSVTLTHSILNQTLWPAAIGLDVLSSPRSEPPIGIGTFARWKWEPLHLRPWMMARVASTVKGIPTKPQITVGRSLPHSPARYVPQTTSL